MTNKNLATVSDEVMTQIAELQKDFRRKMAPVRRAMFNAMSPMSPRVGLADDSEKCNDPSRNQWIADTAGPFYRIQERLTSELENSIDALRLKHLDAVLSHYGHESDGEISISVKGGELLIEGPHLTDEITEAVKNELRLVGMAAQASWAQRLIFKLGGPEPPNLWHFIFKRDFEKNQESRNAARLKQVQRPCV